MSTEQDGPSNMPPGQFPNHMLREIYEQPLAISETIRQNVADEVIFSNSLQPIEKALFAFKKIIIAASGSSRNAGLAGEIMMEDLAGVAVDVEYASEYCYRSTHSDTDPIVVVRIRQRILLPLHAFRYRSDRRRNHPIRRNRGHHRRPT